MGREIRRVPANWQHPRNDKGHCVPMWAASREAAGSTQVPAERFAGNGTAAQADGTERSQMTHDPIPLRAFLDAANKLRFVDRADFERVITPLPLTLAARRWAAFSDDPIRWLAHAPDSDAERVWALAQRGTK